MTAAPDMTTPAAPVPAAPLADSKWDVSTTGTLTNTCGIQDPKASKGVWTVKALSDDEVDLYTGNHATVRLTRIGARYEGEVPEMVSPYPTCTIRDRLRYQVRLQGNGKADGVLAEHFELAAGDCTGVMALPCELAQGLEMTVKP